MVIDLDVNAAISILAAGLPAAGTSSRWRTAGVPLCKNWETLALQRRPCEACKCSQTRRYFHGIKALRVPVDHDAGHAWHGSRHRQHLAVPADRRQERRWRIPRSLDRLPVPVVDSADSLGIRNGPKDAFRPCPGIREPRGAQMGMDRSDGGLRLLRNPLLLLRGGGLDGPLRGRRGWGRPVVSGSGRILERLHVFGSARTLPRHNARASRARRGQGRFGDRAGRDSPNAGADRSGTRARCPGGDAARGVGRHRVPVRNRLERADQRADMDRGPDPECLGHRCWLGTGNLLRRLPAGAGGYCAQQLRPPGR